MSVLELSDVDRIVNQLMSLGTPRDRAIAAAQKHLGLCAPSAAAPDPAEGRDARVREKEEQAAVTKLFREHACVVRSTSQARPSKIAIGFPDLFVTHRTLPLAFFFETKRQVGGVVSEAQQEFADDCRRCGIRWYMGDRFDALRILQELQIPRTP